MFVKVLVAFFQVTLGERMEPNDRSINIDIFFQYSIVFQGSDKAKYGVKCWRLSNPRSLDIHLSVNTMVYKWKMGLDHKAGINILAIKMVCYQAGR